MCRSFQQTIIGEERLHDKPKDICVGGYKIRDIKLLITVLMVPGGAISLGVIDCISWLGCRLLEPTKKT